MANTLLTISMITNEALAVLTNMLTFTGGVNRQYDDQFAVKGAKIGDTVNARKPPRYLGRTGAAISIEDATETSVPVQLTTQRGVDISFTSADLALRIDDFSERFIRPAIANIANKIDVDGLTLATQATYNAVGVPGTTPNALLTYLNAFAVLDNNATPDDDNRNLVITPTANATIVDALKGVFNPGAEVSRQNRRGYMGQSYGMNWSRTQNIINQTVGPLGGVPLVNGAGQTGSNLVTNGWTAAAANRLNKGDVFTIAGVFEVNPLSLQSTGRLKQFVATANTASDGTGAATIPISPAIVGPGTGFQNVSALPASGAAITVLGAAGVVSPQNLLYHRDAFTLACADLPLPNGVDMAARKSDPQTGLSIRMIRAYDINTDKFPCRLDILYGWASLYQEWACRIAG
jgi:hypothetical protein